MTLITSSSEFQSTDRHSDPQDAEKRGFVGFLIAQKKYFFSAYGTIDSSKLSLSSIKYLFDIYYANNELALDALREWMRSPAGIAITVLSTSTLITLSLLANLHDKQDKNHFKYYSAFVWPYVRESLKSVRNVYRAMQSTIVLIYLLDIEDLRHLIVPVSVVLGAMVVANRIWFRYVAAQRAKIMAINKELLEEIKAAKELSPDQINELSKRIAVGSRQLNIELLASSIFTGTIDGLNPYIGTLTVVYLTPALLTAATCFCTFYFFATFMIKIYEEVKVQNQIIQLQKEIEFVLFEKQTGQFIHKNADKSEPALYTGVKNGMAGYKYIMLAISTILFLSPVKIKSLEPISRIFIGSTSVLTALMHACFVSFKNNTKDELKKEKPMLSDYIEGLTNTENVSGGRNNFNNVYSSGLKRNSFFTSTHNCYNEFEETSNTVHLAY